MLPVSRKAKTLDEMLLQLSDGIKEGSRKTNIKKYKPHEKQHKFHCSYCKGKLYIGGNRSGKTTGGVIEDIWRAAGKHPFRPELNELVPVYGRVVAVDFLKGVDQILIPEFKRWCPRSWLKGDSWETAYNANARLLTFKNGSIIEFMSYDQDLDKFAGTSRHFVHFDEEPPRNIWVECMARLIDTDGEYYITMTPVEGMTWIYDDLYENNVNNPDAKVEIIEINTLENPHLSESAVQQFVDIVDSDDVSTRIGGAFVQQGGRVYKNFDPTPGHLQVLSKDLPYWDEPAKWFPNRSRQLGSWMWIMSLDWGLNNPTAVEWTAVNDYGFCVTFAEHYQNELDVREQAVKIKEIINRHGRMPDLLVADPSIKNRSPVTKTSIHEEFAKEGLAFTFGNNDVRAGLVRTRKYFNSYKMVTGLDVPRHPLYADPNKLYPKLYISETCTKLVWELKRYRFKVYLNKKLAYDRNAYEEPNPKDDHACDALRYMIMTRPDLMADSDEMSKSDLDSIMNRLEQKMVRSDRHSDIADPDGLLDASSGWTTGDNMPGPTEWSFDEHLGGYI